MTPDIGPVLVSIALILGNAFFVAAEYSLLAARKSKVDAEARRGNRAAVYLKAALQDLQPYVAGIQIAITMFSVGVGAITEPLITQQLERLLGTGLPVAARVTIAILIVTYLTVVLGELVPKYITLRLADSIALAFIRPLRLFILLLHPLVWLVQKSGALVLRPFGIDMNEEQANALSREELLLLVRTGGAEGTLEQTHADLVSRALRLDGLDARDVMIHRLDVRWLDLNCSNAELKSKVKTVPFSRIPVCRGDIDDVVGIAYLHDMVTRWDEPAFRLESILRKAIMIPENLALDRVLATMRDERTQILVVLDEYGGTSGILTLEDVVEEVFGELEDRLESERPPIERVGPTRISARADVRFDALLEFLKLEWHEDPDTRTLAQLFTEGLNRVPKTGDSIETVLGTMRVENMARRRITRVSVNHSA